VILLVVPFATDDPAAFDLAHYCTVETADALQLARVDARLLADEVEISAEALQGAARALRADAALGATLTLLEDRLELEVLLAGRVFHQSLTIGAVPQAGQVLARAALLALGENAPRESIEAELPAATVLRLVRALTNHDLEEMLALCREDLKPARRALLSLVRKGQGGRQMPALHAALEQFVEDHPDDAEALLLLAHSRADHLDGAGARELFLRVRKSMASPALTAQALRGLATLAVAADRQDEAVVHLRAAVKLTDDAQLFASLGGLLLDKAPQEAIAAFTRATILSPDDAELQLSLAHALRVKGGDLERALAAVTEALRLSASETDKARAREELKSLLQ
jgi:tetratricopeptide (TPR) repeat protein